MVSSTGVVNFCCDGGVRGGLVELPDVSDDLVKLPGGVVSDDLVKLQGGVVSNELQGSVVVRDESRD
jgi:hypothetical protein